MGFHQIIRSSAMMMILLVAGPQAGPGRATGGGWQVAYEGNLDAIRARPGEMPWRAIAWQTDVQEARALAAATGKPIFVWAMAGEPLGCA